MPELENQYVFVTMNTIQKEVANVLVSRQYHVTHKVAIFLKVVRFLEDQTEFLTNIEDKTERLSSLEKFMQIKTQTEVWSKN